MPTETEEILRSELEGLQSHVIELRRAIRRAHEALDENREYDAADILHPYIDL